MVGLLAFGSGAVVQLRGNPAGNPTKTSPSVSTAPVPSASPRPTPASHAGAPGPRIGAALVYDPENKGLILFGGSHNEAMPAGVMGVATADTWLWNGASWRQLEVPGPSARSEAMIAYDSARHVIVLFGGAGADPSGSATLFDDTWTWDGSQWTQMTPVHSPDARYRAAMTFDQERGLAVLFGGEGQTATYTDTWTWDGQDWTLLHPATSPTTRHLASMAYDAGRANIVLFGGSTPGVRLNDTWTWDGATWTRRTATTPASGWSYLTYDARSKEVVAYVYYGLDNHPAAEYTMGWDGTKWTNRSTSHDPSPRAQIALAFDEATGQVLLYGGVFDQPQPFDETWVWDGKTWSLWEAAAGA